MIAAEEELFGHIALRAKLIKRHHLAKALAVQEASKGPARRLLGEILVAMGALRPPDVRNILYVQALSRVANPGVQLIMDVLQNHLATRAQVDHCLKILEQENHSRRVDEVLVAEKVLTREQRDRLMADLVSRHGDSSLLVATIRQAEEESLSLRQVLALQSAQFDDAKNLIAEGVRSLIHLGIISHMVHHQADTHELSELVKVLGEDRRGIQKAMKDLARIQILTEERTWLRVRYRFTTDPNVRERIEILLLCVNDPDYRREIFSLLLKKH